MASRSSVQIFSHSTSLLFLRSILLASVFKVCICGQFYGAPIVQKAAQVASWDPSSLQTDFLNLFGRTHPGPNHLNTCPNVAELLKQQCTGMCSGDQFFYGMNQQHMAAVRSLTSLMHVPQNAQASLCMAEQIRESSAINPGVWIRSLMTTVLSDPELRGLLPRPSLVETFPSMVVHSGILAEARNQAALPLSERTPGCIVLDGSQGGINGIENKLWYWREDIMLNSHHWYWHLEHPFLPLPPEGQTQAPLRTDRRGELFYYVHHSMLARYHSERLSNGLGKVVPLNLHRGAVVAEPYYAFLDGTVSGTPWTDRVPNTRIQDILGNSIPNSPMNISVFQRDEHIRRIFESVQTGTLLTQDNQLIPLNTATGIDLLGELVEASVYSINPSYYSAFGVHNEGHILLALIQDPRAERRLPPGVMGDPSTAMRDPIFYRYHVPIADIFDQHKHYLLPYQPTTGEFPLLWQGVTISDFRVISANHKVNDLTTFWNYAMYDISRGLDFNRTTAALQEGPINVCAQHLDHEQFEYQITIDKDPSVHSNIASVRISLAPRFDEHGQAYTLYQQRDLFFALDFFPAQLNPGRNIIRRSSLASSLTTSWPQRLEELEQDNRNQRPECGCGWPQHLLIPKGTPQGMIFDLFVMVTNGEEDAVPQQPPTNQPTCRPAPIYCGIPGQLYPDRRPMGYPFDRLPYSINEPDQRADGTLDYSTNTRQVKTIAEYVRGLSNTATTPIRITHVNS